MKSFEDACKQVENAARASTKAAVALVSASRELEKSAASGDVSRLRKASESVATARAAADSAGERASSSWPFSSQEEEDYLRVEYRRELLETAKSGGLTMRQDGDTLVAYPLILRVLPEGRAVRIDQKRATALRPSVLLSQLRKLQARKPRVSTDRFMEMLYRTYVIVAGAAGLDTLVPVSKLYEALTLLPGIASEYDITDFTRDLFQLEASGLRVTKHSSRIEWIAPSSATREGKGYSFLTPTGEKREYYGIRFLRIKDGSND